MRESRWQEEGEGDMKVSMTMKKDMGKGLRIDGDEGAIADEQKGCKIEVS